MGSFTEDRLRPLVIKQISAKTLKFTYLCIDL